MSVLSKASQVRCAGIGSVMNSVESLTQRADTLYQDSNAFINGLLVRGEAVEAELKDSVASRKASFTSTFKGTNMIDQAFNSFLAKFGLVEDRRDKKLDELSSKVDNLVEVVAKLAAMKAAEKRADAKPAAKTAAKPAAKKPAARKPAVTKATTAKATAAKAAADKPAAKKPAAKPASKPAAKATTTRKAASSATKSTTTRKRTATKAAKPAAASSDDAAKE